jgi:hypothetical protein
VNRPTEVPVLLALGGASYEEKLVAALERTSSRVRVVRRCLDLADLLSAAVAGTAQVAVVSGALARLDADSVSHLETAGVTVVGIVERTDLGAIERLRAIGIATVMTADSSAGGSTLLAELAAFLTVVPGTPDGSDSEPQPRRPGQPLAAPVGRLLAVWGPIGAPGRTSVATTIADELARMQVETLLADADTYGPSVGQGLGILDEASGLAAAAREANAGLLDVHVLARCARSLRPGLRVLSGVTRPDRWPELPAAALAIVWRTARALAVWTVVDCGFCLELDEEIAFDTAAPRRNGATLVTLESADVVLAVGSADPVGLQRLIRALPELRERAPSAQLRVVVNQVRRGPVGRNPERRLRETLERYAGVTTPIFVPLDRDGFDGALASGRTLAEVADSSPARTRLVDLAADLRAR